MSLPSPSQSSPQPLPKSSTQSSLRSAVLSSSQSSALPQSLTRTTAASAGPAGPTPQNASACAKGQCLCGKVRFSMRFPSIWVAHCHCTRCQRSHGAAFVTWVGAQEGQVEIIDPAQKLCWFRPAGGGERAFCADCGSSMFFRGASWPGELHIARALFSDPLDREPQMHAYYDTHVAWVATGDDLPRKPDPATHKPATL